MPNPRNPNYDGIRARNEEKRRASEAAILAALRAAGKRGLTQRELVQASGVSDPTIRKQMPGWRAKNWVHIGPWELHGTKLVPSYVYGPGKDAKSDDYLHLMEGIVVVDVEREARKEVERKHACWAAKWRPHRPAEAAWI